MSAKQFRFPPLAVVPRTADEMIHDPAFVSRVVRHNLGLPLQDRVSLEHVARHARMNPIHEQVRQKVDADLRPKINQELSLADNLLAGAEMDESSPMTA